MAVGVRRVLTNRSLLITVRVLNPTEKSLGKARLGREELKIARLG